jgi:hypothetical protein
MRVDVKNIYNNRSDIGKWCNSLVGKNKNYIGKRPFGYEEENFFPWNAKISHSYMANEW